jgi:signal transduction histidine kinase
VGILFFLVGSAHHAFAEESDREPKRVLLLYHSYATNLLYAKTIRAELERQMSDSIELYDAPLLPASNKGVEDRYADYLHSRFRDQRLDLVVAIGVGGMTLFRRYRSQAFPSAAMLALLEERRIPNSNLTANEAAVGSSTDFAAIVEHILQVLPETTNVAAVIGDSIGEKYWLKQMRIAFAPFAARVSFTWFNDLSVEDMLNHAATLPPRSAIFFYSLLIDGTGAVHQEDVVFSKLHAVANAPIFTWYDAYFGNGIVGGPLISVVDRTQKIANVAVRILRGEAPSQIMMPSVAFGVPKYDWREMQRWGIAENRLPLGSAVYYRDPTAWQQYRWQIVSIAGALLLQTLLIAGLFYERHRRRDAEAASRQHLSELAHMNRSSTAGELSASIAHEIAQPLAAIVAGGNAGLRWLANATPDLDHARASFEGMIAAAHHAANVVRAIRSMFKKSDDGRAALNPNRLIEEVLELQRVSLRRRRISVETRLSADLPDIMGNRVQLQQVILNLFVNAVDAIDSMADTGRMLKITSDRQEPSGALITIEDSGPGMAPDDMSRIFEPFYTTKPQGMGMGLTICRSIVEAHGGRLIAAPSRLGGLAMQISLPASANGRTRLVDADAAE